MVDWQMTRPVVPNRGAAAPWGAIYSAQGCRRLTRFFTISLKIHFQTVIKPQSKLLWCRKLLFFSLVCRKPKKVGKHWTRQSSVRVTPLLYLVFLLMYLNKIVSQKFWTPCDVHFDKQTRVFGLGLG